MTVIGIVLAGGASSRFGSDKLAADLEGRSVLTHAVERVAEVADRVVLVVAPGTPEPPLAGLVRHPAIARDAATHRGPLAGLTTGLATLTDLEAGDPDTIVLVAGGDMPFLERSVLRMLVATVAGSDATDAAVLEAEPTATLPLAIRAAPAIGAARALLAEDRRSLRGLLDAVTTVILPAASWRAPDPDGRTLRDIDTEADLDRLR